jgi:roadblock/LC7 domain-containing protein
MKTIIALALLMAMLTMPTVFADQAPSTIASNESASVNDTQYGPSIDDLLNISGIDAVGVFSADGRLLDFKSTKDFPPEMINTSIKLCGTVNMMFDSLASMFTELYKSSNDQHWVPQKYWMYRGGDGTMIISGDKGIFINNTRADMPKILEVLGIP